MTNIGIKKLKLTRTMKESAAQCIRTVGYHTHKRTGQQHGAPSVLTVGKEQQAEKFDYSIHWTMC